MKDLSEKDLMIVKCIALHNETAAWLNRCVQEIRALDHKDRGHEPALSYWKSQREAFEVVLSETVKQLNMAEVAKMQDMTVHIVSASPKRGTMQVILKDKEGRYSITRHLKYQFGGWQGYSLLKREIINFSTSNILSETAQPKARAA